jgi:hypothetical protein
MHIPASLIATRRIPAGHGSGISPLRNSPLEIPANHISRGGSSGFRFQEPCANVTVTTCAYLGVIPVFLRTDFNLASH